MKSWQIKKSKEIYFRYSNNNKEMFIYIYNNSKLYLELVVFQLKNFNKYTYMLGKDKIKKFMGKN